MMNKSTLQKTFFSFLTALLLLADMPGNLQAQCVETGTITSPACGAFNNSPATAGGRTRWRLNTVNGAQYTISISSGNSITLVGSLTPATGADVFADINNCVYNATSATITYTRVGASNTTNTGAICEGTAKPVAGSPAGGVWTENGTGSISVPNYTTGNIAANETVTTTYTYGGCAANAAFTVNVNNGEGITNSTNTSAICEGTAKALAASPAGGTWTENGSGSVALPNYNTGNIAANENVTVTYTIAANGACPLVSAGQTFTVNVNNGEGISNTTTTTAICEGTNKALAASPAGGTWTENGTGSISLPNYTTGNISADEAVTVTYSIAANGACPLVSAGQTFTVNVNNGEGISNTTTTTAICEGTNKALAASPAGGTWTENGTGSISLPNYTTGSIAADESVTVTYTIAANGACPITSAGRTFTVNANPNISAPVAVCDNTTATVSTDVGSITSFSITPDSYSGTTYDPHNVSIPTQFENVTITATNGVCVPTTVIRVDNNPNAADAGSDLSQCNNPNFVMAANTSDVTGSTTLWNCTANCTGVTYAPGTSNTQTVSGLTAGTGTATTMTWTITNGVCSSTDAIDLRNYLPITVSGSSQICDDNTGVTFTSSPSGGTGWAYIPTGPLNSTGGSISGGSFTVPDVTGSNTTQTANITVQNGACTSPPFAITIYNLPDNNTLSTSMCEGETRPLLSTVSGVTWISSPCPGCVSGSTWTAPDPGGASAGYNITARNGGSFCQSGSVPITVYKVATITSSNTDMCEGDVRTPLTANLTPGTFSGTGVVGTTFTAPSVAVPTTPYVIEYVLNGAPATCKATQTINVLNRSDNPTSATATPATPICNGSTVDLTLAGGGNGANENVRWYTGSPGGTLIGTGNPLTVTPPSNATTTYYGRYENGAPCSYTTTSQSVAVTTQVASSVAGASLTATPSVIECIGTSTTLNVVSGSLGTAATWNLYSGSCGGTFITSNGTGIFNVTPTANTDYYVRAQGCNTTACVNVTVNANGPVDLIPTSGVKTCTFNGTYAGEKFLVNSSNEALLSINEGAVDLGSVTATVTKHGSVPTIAGSTQCDAPMPSVGPVGGDELYLPREFDITTSNVPSGFVTVSLYFTQAELTALRTATLAASAAYQSCWGTVANDGSNLMLTINHTDNTYETRTQGGGGLTLTTTGPNGSYKASFQVNKFSGFKFHGNGGVNGANGLPVEMIYFSASPVNNVFIQLTWATALEIDNDGFQVERSEDGQTWNTIGWVDGGNNSTIQLSYSFDDFNVLPGIRYYYRLKQIDNDGDFEYHGPETAILDGEVTFDVMDLMPNPTMNATSLIVTSVKEQQITVDVFDILGQKVSSQVYTLAKKANTINIDCSKFAAGTYTVAVTSGNQTYAKKLIITR